MASWSVQGAKARFREFLDAAIKDGPQFVTRRGVQVAVFVSIEQWKRLQEPSRHGLKALLLSAEARTVSLVIKRRSLRRKGSSESLNTPKIC